MIKGTFSDQSPWFQFLMIFVLALLGALIFTFLGLFLLPVFFAVSFSDLFSIASDVANIPIGMLKFLQGFSSIGTFFLPALVAAYLFSNSVSRYMSFSSFPDRPVWVVILVVVLTLSGNAISDTLFHISKELQWPDTFTALKNAVQSSEAASNAQISRFLEMHNFLDFMGVFLVMAILPAICEEALFRGVLQKVLKRVMNNTHLGIGLTALLFALMHLQFYTFLSIFVLGIILGYLKEWSGSLWVPMIMHLVNNGSIVVAVYFFGVDFNNTTAAEGWQLGYTIPGLLVFAGCLLLLRRVLSQSAVTKKEQAEG